MAKIQTVKPSKFNSWVDRWTPQCGLTGMMVIIGCSYTIYGAEMHSWSPWDFGGVFCLIMGGGKGMKILGDKLGTSK